MGNRKSQSIILPDFSKRAERKLQSFDWEKDQKRRQNEPENPPRKEQGKGKQKRRGERKEEKEKKKSNGCTLSFYVDFFERKKTV